MESPTANVPLKFNRFLPYWAVLQTDLRQTLRSWVYRLWVAVMVLAAGGFMLYRAGIHREAGIVQPASVQTSDLVRLLVFGSLALIVVLTVSSISSERGTVADAVLSRGISRHQYFLAKWHARLVVLVSTVVVFSLAVLLAGYYLLESDLTLRGSLMAIVAVAAILAAIVSWGVAVGALTNSTVLGVTVFWILLYGSGFALSLLPEPWPTPDRAILRLKAILKWQESGAPLYESVVSNIVLVSLGLSLAAGVVGLIGFSRKDV